MACALWALAALASVYMREGLGGVVLLSAPSGVAVAAFRYLPRPKWLLLVVTMLPTQVLVVSMAGVTAQFAVAYALSVTTQAFVCAALSRWVLGGRLAMPRRISEVVGLFIAAFVACVIGAAIVWPVRAAVSIEELGAWCFANILGILILTPALLHARKALAQLWDSRAVAFDLQLLASLAGCAVLAVVALQVSAVTLMPLLVAAMIVMAVRFGYTAIALTLLTYIAVASVLSLNGGSPMPQHDGTRLEAVLALQSWLLTMLATALPLAAVFMKSEELQIALIRRNSAMHENLMLLDLAEQLAGIGRWRLDLETGEQDWSPRMLELHGLPAELAPDPGDVSHILPGGGEAMLRKVASKREEREPFSFNYRITLDDGSKRILRISVLNEFNSEGRRIAIFGAAMDVTEQKARERALDLALGRAEQMADEAQELANTDPLTDLPNRRCTFGRLDAMVETARGSGSALTAIMFDIDHFKAVNDTFGHQTGDEVIVQVADLARKQARQSDLVGRIGGEEFVWLLPGIDSRAARMLAERLRKSVEGGNEGSSLPRITISVGLAHFERGDSGADLLARADAALYEAKQSGRNQVRRAA
ncbi:diguanylate cyclase [Erythrobacter alti]|uniref:sensor domain-containing diguanylate cyclase n=1 Tax=Erythrobacter alti TaxID=1896145 RepID=UPI0030F37BB0